MSVFARNRNSGFSLMELIIVIVLVGILATGAGMLIKTPIDAYQDQARRTRLVDRAELAMRQIERELRNALPNSVRVQPVGAGWALEFTPSLDGARYRDEPGGVFTTDATQLDFSTADRSFNLLGKFRNLVNGALPPSQRLVIFNTSAADFYNDATSGGSGRVTPAGTAITLITFPSDSTEQSVTMNPPFLFSEQSPSQRIYVVDSPISYICDNGTIMRHSGYGFQDDQETDFSTLASKSGEVADLVQPGSCQLDYQPGSAQRGGTLSFQVSLAEAGEVISLLYQVHVENSP